MTPLPPAEPLVDVDPAARRIRLDPATLGSAIVFLAGEGVPPAARPHLDALARAGVIGEGGALCGWLAAMLGVVARAGVEAVVEQFGTGPSTRHTIWIEGEDAVAADHRPDATVVLMPLPTDLVAATVAALVGLDAGQPPASSGIGPLRRAAVAHFHRCLIADDAPGAMHALAQDPNLTAEDLELLLDLVTGRCESWRLTVATRVLTVVDGGNGRFWRSTADLSDVVLEPVTPLALWQHLHTLLPGTCTSPVHSLVPVSPPCRPPVPDPKSSWSTPPRPASAA